MRWLLGDQLGPAFDDGGPVLLVESRRAFARAPVHRQKAHLLLSAMRHRAAELGSRAVTARAGTYGEALAEHGATEVIAPTSRGARSIAERAGLAILPARGFIADETEFAAWAAQRGRRRLLLEDWYRHVRASRGWLMAGDAPVTGRWNYDEENRQPPPRRPTLGLPDPWQPVEDAIDAEVREELDRWERSGTTFIGRDGPRRFAATRTEALAALDDFVRHRLAHFGPYEDAALAGDWAMAHSLLSVPMNLGLLHPVEAIDAVIAAYDDGTVPIASAEGFVRQVAGWREYTWQLFWHLGDRYADSNALDAREPLPAWFAELDADATGMRCLSTALGDVRDRAWSHHILRLMVLGNWALQRGYEPGALAGWFTRSFADGYPWVMAANVIGMSQHADGGLVATKPYAAGGAYVKRMTDFCGGCRYRPQERTGERACPMTAGYWWFLDRNAERLRGNHRMAQPLAGLARLADREAVVEQERTRGSAAP